MRLGTRWTSGDEPPQAVPDVLRAQIAAVDAAAATETAGQPRPRWTLTWLENRPVAELETGVIVELLPDRTVSVRRDDDTFA